MRIFQNVIFYQKHTVIISQVIYQKDFQILIGLIYHRLQATDDVIFAVINRDGNGNKRKIHRETLRKTFVVQQKQNYFDKFVNKTRLNLVYKLLQYFLRKKIFSELRKNEKSTIPNSTKIGNYTNCIISPDAYIYFGNKIDIRNNCNFVMGKKAELKDRKSTRLNSSHSDRSRMPSSA